MSDDYSRRFGGIERLYGSAAVPVLRDMHVFVAGVGGVGSWVVEALARSGIGRLTFIDGDTVDIGNANRQLHTLSATFDRPKVEVMAERVRQISPDCQVAAVHQYLNMENMQAYLENDYDYVIDALDSIKFKSNIIAYCRRNKVPIVATGGAGGLTDPTMIHVADLSKTYNDPLAAKVRGRLRGEFGFSRNPKRSFGVECVFSSQQQVYPKEDGRVSHEKPGIHGVSLDCRFGYGSASFVTAAFGFVAASRAINKTLKKKLA
ncbi:sulfur acceptor protein CsdL [Candidatus Tenderia electrophaga]|jgi:tRNA A37 threonylcarbamoyladenosine dehydratase|uniref:Sulfur acceptor protein CsdL n=1 Tax=Candidatus Tenderia electrophaga TaxID=1748243 RepID=A0A0S2TAQ9_9GAMM|nr:sulfur acceptor protein CsdL [Candidatus Tenderia electrophaga]